MTRPALALAALCVLLLAACNPLARDTKIDAEVQSVFDQLRHHQDAALRTRMTPDLALKVDAATMARIESYVPPGEPLKRTQTATGLFSPNGKPVAQVRAQDEYRYADGTLLVQTQLVRPDGAGPWRIEGINVRYATKAQLAVNRFTLAGKTPVQYLVLLWTVLSPALMIAALVKVVRTRGLRRKWLWGLLAFVGLFSIRMNWTTGAARLMFLSVQFIGAGIMKSFSDFAPWVLTATVPVGAVLILTGVWANPARAKKPPPPDPAVF